MRVGMEATGYSRWFERLLAELGFEVWMGDPAEIKAKRVKKQKYDREDARLLLRLMPVRSTVLVCEVRWVELYRAAALEGVNRPMHNRIRGFASATLLATTTPVLSLSVAAQQVPQQLQPSADEQLLLQVRTARRRSQTGCPASIWCL